MDTETTDFVGSAIRTATGRMFTGVAMELDSGNRHRAAGRTYPTRISQKQFEEDPLREFLGRLRMATPWFTSVN